MKTLIYQYWYGKQMQPGAVYGRKVMSEYAERIGAEYRFERNPKFFEGFVEQPVSYSALMPVFNEEYHDYDAVLVIDMDVYPIEGLTENIFETDFGEMAMCQEAHMPALKKKYRPRGERGYNTHVAWSVKMFDYYGVEMPKNEDGLYKIFNSGVVLYSKEGMKKAKNFTHPQKFVNKFKPHFSSFLFWRDQAYAHALFCAGGLDSRELDTKWNSLIQWMPNKDPKEILDCRNNNANFIHAQLNGAGNWSDKELWTLTNEPHKLKYNIATTAQL
jgi:hypothetical protein